ncbi:protein FAM163B [Pteropus vampyrus]|uniref:Protein FAM163B n=1 Tax=Pteropus vampyrus TaxID=132908 RepID=A0A6P3RSR4_PTEVA|nr:protein FAM163B [Pteropus vampyrus]
MVDPGVDYEKSPQARALCRSCSHHEPPAFFLQEPEEGSMHNGGQRVAYQSLGQDDLELPPGTFGGLQALNPNRLSAMREAFSRSRSISTDV